MKKFLIISSFLAALILSSCSDFLDTDSSSGLPPEESITNLDDLRNAVNGVYMVQTGAYRPNSSSDYVRGVYAGDFILFADLRSGDFEPIDTYNQIAPVAFYTVDRYHTIAENYYAAFYECLAKINSVLELAGEMDQKDKDTDTYKNLIGELYTLRALFHFDLARLYAHLPTIADDVDAPQSGIVLSDEVFDSSIKKKRSTIAQTYQFILDDLARAFESTMSVKKQNGRVNYWTAKAIQARVFLYLGRDQDALEAAEEVINDSPYALYLRDEYTSVWSKENTSESIFEILTTSIYNAQRNSAGFYTHADGYAECGVTEDFKEFLESRTSDIRAELIAYEEASDDYGTFNEAYYPQKYPGRSGDLYQNNPKVVRLSEVYLIAAEAAVKIPGQESKAADYINRLRGKRIDGYVDVASVTLDDVITERRLELFAEGHYAWDLWRNMKSLVNINGDEINYDDYRTVLPIPQREIDIYSELKQNDEY